MRFAFPILACISMLLVLALPAQDYDPLRVTKNGDVTTTDLAVQDTARQREIPLRIYFTPRSDSAQESAAPLVLFSHGLGGTREGCSYLGKHWAGRGYVVVFLQHPGSDDSVWKNQPLAKRMAAMQEAASAQNFLLRLQDVPVVLDQLEKWASESSHPLAGRLDMQRIGMSGHSFGAQTTQGLAGQSMPLVGQRYNEPRIKAAVVMSPSGARRGGDSKTTFAGVKLPWLLMTGTKDTSPIGSQTVETRLSVFPALPAGEKYELVLHNGEHSAFSDRALPGDQVVRNANHHRAILALSTAFWDAYLDKDTAARKWLDGTGPRTVLQDDDRWQQK